MLDVSVVQIIITKGFEWKLKKNFETHLSENCVNFKIKKSFEGNMRKFLENFKGHWKESNKTLRNLWESLNDVNGESDECAKKIKEKLKGTDRKVKDCLGKF